MMNKDNQGLYMTAFIFNIISLVGLLAYTILLIIGADYILRPVTEVSGLTREEINSAKTVIMIFVWIFALIPFFWMIPMTIHLKKCHSNGGYAGTAFKVCNLLFCSFISGIILLCVNEQ